MRINARLLTFYICSAVLLAACAGSKKYFRKTTGTEAAAIKSTKKQLGKADSTYHILIMTDSGNMVVKLYNQTPLHRDNFVQKVQAGFYDSLLFHRVIKNFMIQGGDPNSKHARAGEVLGEGSAPGDRIPAEFRPELFHKKGVLAAARDGNPEKASSNCQFYLVQGKAYRPAELDSYIVRRNLPPIVQAQKEVYTSMGGTPHLDKNYTVFGEIESGLEVLDKIAFTPTNPGDRPKADIRMRMFIVSKPKK